MKKCLSILLLVAVLAQTFVNVGLGVYYHLNKEYIAQQLCENRSRPEMHCNGHCYLSKQLKKAEENEKHTSNLLKEKEEIITTPFQLADFIFIPSTIVTFIKPANQALPFAGYSQWLLKPPSA